MELIAFNAHQDILHILMQDNVLVLRIQVACVAIHAHRVIYVQVRIQVSLLYVQLDLQQITKEPNA